MSPTIKRIKEKVLSLPPLSLPTGEGDFIIETDASNIAWGGVLLEKIDGVEVICAYTSGSFKCAELNYPSSHKEILDVKKVVRHFRLYLKPIKFIIRTNLKFMPGIFKNENLMAENNSRILKWFVWLQNFDYEIVYKPGYLNCIANMLTREKLDPRLILGMFFAGTSSKSGSKKQKLSFDDFIEDDVAEHTARKLFVSSMLTKEERLEMIQDTSSSNVQHFLDLTLIKAIKESPCKINILEKWEHTDFNG